MKAPSPTITREEWLAAWDEVVGERADTVPPGWQTIEEFGAVIGKRETMARTRMAALVKAGKAESRTFRLRYPCGLRNISHYRLKK